MITTPPTPPRLSISLPAKNEAQPLRVLVEGIRKSHPDAEIIVIDDDSEDATTAEATAGGARVIQNPYSMGTAPQ